VPKAPAPPPPATDQTEKPADDANKPPPTNVPRTGDPCDGGEKPH
jgi:hypothetical protein